MDDRDAINAWRELFRGGQATPTTLKEAEALLQRISEESPVRSRLASELEQLKKKTQTVKKKRSGARRS